MPDHSWPGDDMRPWRSREELLEWLRANGLDLNRIPQDSTFTIDSGPGFKLLTVEYVALDEQGRKRLDPDTPNAFLRVKHTVPIRVPLPIPTSRFYR